MAYFVQDTVLLRLNYVRLNICSIFQSTSQNWSGSKFLVLQINKTCSPLHFNGPFRLKNWLLDFKFKSSPDSHYFVKVVAFSVESKSAW